MCISQGTLKFLYIALLEILPPMSNTFLPHVYSEVLQIQKSQTLFSQLVFPPFFFFAVRINLPICISPLSPPLLKVLLPHPILLILNQNILDHAKEHFALVGDGDFKRIGEDSYYANDNSF